MSDYLCLTLLAREDESPATFKARLTEFWTHMLRQRPDDYEKVYAEATTFGQHEGHVTRQYMVEADGIEVLEKELAAHGIAYHPIDPDDVYSKYEASSPEWFQIEH